VERVENSALGVPVPELELLAAGATEFPYWVAGVGLLSVEEPDRVAVADGVRPGGVPVKERRGHLEQPVTGRPHCR
jgi:hypothetical protein